MKSRIRRRFSVTILAVTLAVALLVGGGLAVQRQTNNFHAIVDGEAYRSAQPSPDQITSYKKTYGIATIINLRGKQEHAAWYDDEIRTADELGIQHVDFGMSARRELSPDEARALIEVMKTAPKPVLIHCKAGSDRSGLAAALYLAAVKGTAEETAEGQLSIRFGHIAVPIVGTYAMDRTFEVMEPSLGFEGS